MYVKESDQKEALVNLLFDSKFWAYIVHICVHAFTQGCSDLLRESGCP